MPRTPDWKRYLEAGMQFTELRRSQARAVAADLGEPGSARPRPGRGRGRRDRRDEPAPQRRLQRHRARRGAAAARLARARDAGRPRRLEQKLNTAVKKSAEARREEGDEGGRAEKARREGAKAPRRRRRAEHPRAPAARRRAGPARARAESRGRGRSRDAGAGPRRRCARPPARPDRSPPTSRSRSPDPRRSSCPAAALKLAAALDAFGIDAHGRDCVDVGASTGGFTDCLLQRGAHHVVAIDVGRGQLAWTLRNDPRVTVMERTNVRSARAGALEPPPDSASSTCRSSRCARSRRHLLGHHGARIAIIVLLVKPQFEAGRARVGKGGVVRDVDVRADVVAEVVAGLDDAGARHRRLARVADHRSRRQRRVPRARAARTQPVSIPRKRCATIVRSARMSALTSRRPGPAPRAPLAHTLALAAAEWFRDRGVEVRVPKRRSGGRRPRAPRCRRRRRSSGVSIS